MYLREKIFRSIHPCWTELKLPMNALAKGFHDFSNALSQQYLNFQGMRWQRASMISQMPGLNMPTRAIKERHTICQNVNETSGICFIWWHHLEPLVIHAVGKMGAKPNGESMQEHAILLDMQFLSGQPGDQKALHGGTSLKHPSPTSWRICVQRTCWARPTLLTKLPF